MNNPDKFVNASDLESDDAKRKNFKKHITT